MTERYNLKLVEAMVDAWNAEYQKYGTAGTMPTRVIDQTADIAGVILFQGTMDECLAWIDQQCASAALAAIDAAVDEHGNRIAWVAPWEAPLSGGWEGSTKDCWEEMRDACLAERRSAQQEGLEYKAECLAKAEEEAERRGKGQ